MLWLETMSVPIRISLNIVHTSRGSLLLVSQERWCNTTEIVLLTNIKLIGRAVILCSDTDHRHAV
jgi:hypothetical protein